jgi:hypothetical protein
LELLKDRYGRKSTFIATQIPISLRFDAIGDKAIADAICDRFLRNSEKIELKVRSARKIKNNSGRNLPPENNRFII